jgi:hypothetical protein
MLNNQQPTNTHHRIAFPAVLCLIELKENYQFSIIGGHVSEILTGVKNDSATNLARAFSWHCN